MKVVLIIATVFVIAFIAGYYIGDGEGEGKFFRREVFRVPGLQLRTSLRSLRSSIQNIVMNSCKFCCLCIWGFRSCRLGVEMTTNRGLCIGF